MVKIRTADAADAKGILEIYAPHVLHTPVTFETAVPLIEEMQSRIASCLQKFPWLVCQIEEEIAGYAYAHTHREREAYQWTCECSVYVHEKHQGRGIGTALYQSLFGILKQQGLVNLYAGIVLPNAASVTLHERCGFVLFAEYDNIGYKAGTWHKVGWWSLQLNDHQPKPPPPLPFPRLSPTVYTQAFEEAAALIRQGF